MFKKLVYTSLILSSFNSYSTQNKFETIAISIAKEQNVNLNNYNKILHTNDFNIAHFPHEIIAIIPLEKKELITLLNASKNQAHSLSHFFFKEKEPKYNLDHDPKKFKELCKALDIVYTSNKVKKTRKLTSIGLTQYDSTTFRILANKMKPLSDAVKKYY